MHFHQGVLVWLQNLNDKLSTALSRPVIMSTKSWIFKENQHILRRESNLDLIHTKPWLFIFIWRYWNTHLCMSWPEHWPCIPEASKGNTNYLAVSAADGVCGRPLLIILGVVEPWVSAVGWIKCVVGMVDQDEPETGRGSWERESHKITLDTRNMSSGT